MGLREAFSPAIFGRAEGAEVDSNIRRYNHSGSKSHWFTQSHGVPREPRTCNPNQSKNLPAPPRGHFYLAITWIVTSGLKCPVLLYLEMSALGFVGTLLPLIDFDQSHASASTGPSS